MMEGNKFRPRPSQELCPFETVEWEKLKTKWNCTDPADYHCLPDQYNVPGQICVKPHWVLKNYCPIYNTAAAKIDLLPCDLQYGACSDKDYRSNEVFRYSACLNKTEIYKESSTLKPDPPILPLMAGIMAVAVVVLCLLVSAACVIYTRRRRRENEYEDYHQLQPLLDQSSIPVGLQKVMDYLKNGVFSSSKFYEHAIGVLDIHGCVSLIGPPGSGKTLTAVQLAFRKYGEGQGGMSRFHVYHSVEELAETDHTDGEYIIVDDWLDQYMHYPTKLEEDKKRLDEFYANVVKSKKGRIIFTAQEDRWKIFRDVFSKCELFDNKCLLTINSKSFERTTELKRIVQKNLKHCSILEGHSGTKNKKKLNEVDLVKIKWEAEFSFPLIVDLICVNRRLAESLHLILKDGFTSILKKFLDNWSEDKDIDERRSFCILVFTAFLGGVVTLSSFKSQITGPLYERICDKYACVKPVEKSISKEQETRVADEHLRSVSSESDEKPIITDGNKDIKKQNSKQGYITTEEQTILEETLLHKNQRLRGCLFKVSKHEEDPVFVFQHNALLRFVLQFIFKSEKGRFFIENASIEVLRKNCWIEHGYIEKLHALVDGKRLVSPAGLVIFPTSTLKPLTERIYSLTIGYNPPPQWSGHVFMNNKTFLETWKKTVAIGMESRQGSSESRQEENSL